jgi:hypothetical protein
VTSLLMKHLNEMIHFDEYDPIAELNILLDKAEQKPNASMDGIIFGGASLLQNCQFHFLCHWALEKSV